MHSVTNLYYNAVKDFKFILLPIFISFLFISLADSFCTEYYDFNNIKSQEFLPPEAFGDWNPEKGAIRFDGAPNSNFGFAIKYPARISFDWNSTAGKEGAGAVFFNKEELNCGSYPCRKLSHYLEPGKIEWEILGTGYVFIDNLSVMYENSSCSGIYPRYENNSPEMKNSKVEDKNSTELEAKPLENTTENDIIKPAKREHKYNSSCVLVDPNDPNENHYIFRSIGTAIQKVDEYGIILIKENNYKEKVVIEKPLTLRGLAREGVILNDIRDNPTILIKNDNVVLENLTIKGYNVAIKLKSVINCRIINNTIDQSHETGLFLDNANEIHVGNNLIRDCKNTGIAIQASDKNYINNNTIENCYSGISVESSERNEFNRNVFGFVNCIFLCVDSPNNEYPNDLINCTRYVKGIRHTCYFYGNNDSCPLEEI